MFFIDYYHKSLHLYERTGGGIKTRLALNNPAFDDATDSKYIAFCLMDNNLEPLGDDTVIKADLNPERLPAKFAIAMKNTNFSWFRLMQCLVFVLRIQDLQFISEADLIEKYSAAAEDFISIVEADFSISLTISITEPFNNLSQCEAVVRDALIRVDFACYIEEPVSVVDKLYYHEMQRLLHRQHPEYKLVNYERPIIAAVLSRNFLHAELVVNKFLIAHLCDPIHIFPTINTSMVNICRIVGALASIDPWELGIQIPMINESLEQMRSCITLKEMKALIHLQFTLIREHVESNDNLATANKKMERILDFIHANYTNPSFGAGMISEKFKVNPAYLSRLFKEQIGINFLAYVQTLRIEAAKELLRTNEMTVERIAIEVGYIGSQNLLRLFKKFESVSPTEYRALVHGISNEEYKSDV